MFLDMSVSWRQYVVGYVCKFLPGVSQNTTLVLVTAVINSKPIRMQMCLNSHAFRQSHSVIFCMYEGRFFLFHSTKTGARGGAVG
jgi:hypothetical protein